MSAPWVLRESFMNYLLTYTEVNPFPSLVQEKMTVRILLLSSKGRILQLVSRTVHPLRVSSHNNLRTQTPAPRGCRETEEVPEGY